MGDLTKNQLAVILERHGKWLRNEEGGERADLSYSDLRHADLHHANLSFANLRSANLRSADLRSADLSYANLCHADLRYAHLKYANFNHASLRFAYGNAEELKTMHIETYPISYTAEIMQIGCERHPIADWWAFDNERIAEMDDATSLEFWGKWKVILRQIIEMSPATPTGHETKTEEAA